MPEQEAARLTDDQAGQQLDTDADTSSAATAYESDAIIASEAEQISVSVGDVRRSIAITTTHLEKAAEQIVWQVQHKVWTLLGYTSWDDMREAEYGGAAVMVPRSDRPELVAAMKAEGLSHQQIGDTLGVSKQTVSNDVSNFGHVELPATRVDSLGREQPTRKAREADETKVPARRSALPKQASSAGFELQKAVERVQRIADDDRFEVHRDAIRPHLSSHLRSTVDMCQSLLDRLSLDGDAIVEPPSHGGVSEWSDRVQTITATCDTDDLTDEQLVWLRGAATYLCDLTLGALVLRKKASSDEHRHRAAHEDMLPVEPCPSPSSAPTTGVPRYTLSTPMRYWTDLLEESRTLNFVNQLAWDASDAADAGDDAWIDKAHEDFVAVIAYAQRLDAVLTDPEARRRAAKTWEERDDLKAGHSR